MKLMLRLKAILRKINKNHHHLLQLKLNHFMIKMKTTNSVQYLYPNKKNKRVCSTIKMRRFKLLTRIKKTSRKMSKLRQATPKKRV